MLDVIIFSAVISYTLILLLTVNTIINLLTFLNQKTMSNEINEIKDVLVATKEIVTNVKADVELLHTKIGQVNSNSPTADQWTEIKNIANGIKDTLTEVDDLTPAEEVVEPPIIDVPVVEPTDTTNGPGPVTEDEQPQL